MRAPPIASEEALCPQTSVYGQGIQAETLNHLPARGTYRTTQVVADEKQGFLWAISDAFRSKEASEGEGERWPPKEPQDGGKRSSDEWRGIPRRLRIPA